LWFFGFPPPAPVRFTQMALFAGAVRQRPFFARFRSLVRTAPPWRFLPQARFSPVCPTFPPSVRPLSRKISQASVFSFDSQHTFSRFESQREEGVVPAGPTAGFSAGAEVGGFGRGLRGSYGGCFGLPRLRSKT